MVNKLAGAAEQVKLKGAGRADRQRDTEQLSSVTGAARTTDGIGGLVIGRDRQRRRLGWSNTNEGKVIAALPSMRTTTSSSRLRVLAAKPARAGEDRAGHAGKGLSRLRRARSDRQQRGVLTLPSRA